MVELQDSSKKATTSMSDNGDASMADGAIKDKQLESTTPEEGGRVRLKPKEESYYHAPPSKTKEVNFTDLNYSIESLKAQIARLNLPDNNELSNLVQQVDTNITKIGASIGCTFTLFPHLPTELRLRIWSLAAHQPRIVDVRTRMTSAGRFCFYARNLQCALTRTSREARNEAIIHRLPFYTDPSLPVIYINGLVHTFLYSSDDAWELRSWMLIHMLNQGRGKDIRHLMCAYDFFLKEVGAWDRHAHVEGLLDLKLRKLCLVEQRTKLDEMGTGVQWMECEYVRPKREVGRWDVEDNNDTPVEALEKLIHEHLQYKEKYGFWLKDVSQFVVSEFKFAKAVGWTTKWEDIQSSRAAV